jgi:ArsR family transcriptional regulator, arsenate/arsenite/antimonite-responsive transcriptional repressor
MKKRSTLSLEELFAALSDRTRLRLLTLMQSSEVCVCFFVEVIDVPQPTISRHLAFLRRAGLVQTRKEGRWVHYALAALPSPLRHVLDVALKAAAQERQMQKDREALDRACCSPRAPEILKRAPRPTAM